MVSLRLKALGWGNTNRWGRVFANIFANISSLSITQSRYFVMNFSTCDEIVTADSTIAARVAHSSKHRFENHPDLTRPYGSRLVTDRTP